MILLMMFLVLSHLLKQLMSCLKPLNDIAKDVPSVKSPLRYELPPRSTRGILAKRYDLEFKAQRSRYPIN